MARFFWFLTATAAVLYAPRAACEAIDNGGFENGLTNWFCQGTCTLTPSSDAYSGTGSAMVTGRQQRPGLAQKVTITTGTRYKFTAFIKFLAPGAMFETVELVVRCKDSNNNDELVWTKFGKVTRVRLGEWTMVGDFNFIPAGLHKCRAYVQVWRIEANYLVDDVSLVEVPELTNWRAEANARIEQERKSDLTVRMQATVPGTYTVEIEQTSNLFGFGSAVASEEMVNENFTNYQNFVYQHFEWATLANALKWRLMEWHRDSINYEKPGLALDALKAHGIKIRGHNVFWGVEKSVPYWVKNLSYTELVSEMNKRVNYVVNFTKGRVEHWDVNNENLHGDWFEQKLNDSDATSKMFVDVHAVDGDVQLFLNDYGVMGVNMAVGYRNQGFHVNATGAPIYGMGIQSHLSPDRVDMTLVKHRLDTVAEARLPIWITELTVNEPNATLKAQVLDDLMTMYFSYPAIKGIVLWGFWDGKIGEPTAALFEGPNLEPNEAGTKYLNLRQQWRTSETLTLSETESETVRCFKGGYSVVVKRDGAVVKEYEISVEDDTDLDVVITQ